MTVELLFDIIWAEPIMHTEVYRKRMSITSELVGIPTRAQVEQSGIIETLKKEYANSAFYISEARYAGCNVLVRD